MDIDGQVNRLFLPVVSLSTVKPSNSMALVRRIQSAPSKRNGILGVFLIVAALAVLLHQDAADLPSYSAERFSKIEAAAGKKNIALAVENHVVSSKLIWTSLSNEERGKAMALVLPYIVDFVRELNATKQDQWWDTKRCANVIRIGTQWGTHQLCDYPPPNCLFVSFGISSDYSFDTDLAEKWTCRGFAADPTIIHKSLLHENVTFHNIAASTIKANIQSKAAKQEWWTTTVPSLKRFLQLDRIHILKMDCEGCEYALARDILLEEPNFFHSVDQFTFEAHLNILWLNDVEQFYYYAMLLKLLREAGLVLAGSSIGGCGWDNEKEEVMDELRAIGYPGLGRKKLYARRSCHEYLFARIPTETH